MATVNLGSIKFKWKGTYNGATAYTVDDVVEYNGSSYICILASTGNLPTNATYFEQMSSAGTNGTDGTDLTTTLTTQGDIVYRDASGLARLGAGTSGQVLQTGGTGANVSWVDAPSGVIKKIHYFENSTRIAPSNTVDNKMLWTNSFVPLEDQINYIQSVIDHKFFNFNELKLRLGELENDLKLEANKVGPLDTNDINDLN